jgi:2-dehydropantoate 2-reductase
VRICVVGCGAVGSLFAANLSLLDDVEVWAYDLARDHVDAINRDGLRLTGAGDVLGKVRATAERVAQLMTGNQLMICSSGDIRYNMIST